MPQRLMLGEQGHAEVDASLQMPVLWTETAVIRRGALARSEIDSRSGTIGVVDPAAARAQRFGRSARCAREVVLLRFAPDAVIHLLGA